MKHLVSEMSSEEFYTFITGEQFSQALDPLQELESNGDFLHDGGSRSLSNDLNRILDDWNAMMIPIAERDLDDGNELSGWY